MSSFFSQASFVMDPSVYRAGTLFVPKPTDGSGDLTITRTGDTATRVGPNGYIEKVRTNLFPTGSALLATGWISVGATLTAGQTDPNGGTTALRVQLAAAQAPYAYILQGFTGSAATYARSAYIKAASAQSIRIVDPYSGAGTTVNLTTDWQRFTAVGAGAFSNFGIQFDNNNDAAAKDFTIAFVQIEEGDIATDYIPTTTTAVSVGPVANVPRLNYSEGCPSLLLEPQRTNGIVWSEQIDNAAWTKTNCTISANNAVSPDGYTNADKIVENTATGLHGVQSGNFTSSAGVVSVFVKAAGRTFFNISEANGVGGFYNLTTGAATGSFATASMQDYGNGWWRCVLQYTFPSAFATNFRFYAATSMSVNSYAGDGSSGVLIYGAQFENGAAYATSYIPTLASASTRGADAAVRTGASSFIGQTEGTLFCDVEWTVKPESGSPIISLVALNNTTNLQNCIVLGIERQSGGTNRFYSFAQVSNSTTAALIGSNLTNGRYKAAIAYKENDFVLYVNGVQIATDTSGAVPTNSQVIVGGRFVGDSFQVSDPISQALVFKTRLPNSELAKLTSL